jgi:pimeloyl-ACP methyl ester carboxylesterase
MSVSSRSMSLQPIGEDRGESLVADRRVRVDGVDLQYLEAGSGPPLLLLHGHEQSATSWRWVIPVLARTHRVLALSLPGHGKSAPAVGGYAPGRDCSWPTSSTPSGSGRCTWSGTQWAVRSRYAWPWPTRPGCRP